ncbi:hypothetical protein [Limnohabitans radicicola]|uniref:DUF8201 domain-containing protein n=1 Tax=Limnohabitans radicicola TaxID=2771427 RepID=A0A927FE51_9BURK|nr:hypothetical protein [Limnohabitans radicicola]MBD8049679.1 hypothetical protein [Limnohabitans radicicola]
MLNAPTHLTGLTEFFWGLMFCVYCATLGLAVLKTPRLFNFSRKFESVVSPLEINFSLIIFIATCTGLAVVSQMLFLLGLFKVLSPSVMIISLLSLWLLACMQLWTTRTKSALIPNWMSLLQGSSTGIIFLCIGLTLTWLCIKPPGLWDDTSYHLPYARHYLQEHQLSVTPWLRFPLFPHNGNLLFTFALTWGSEVRAQVIATAIPLTVTAIGIYGACQEFLKSKWSGWLAIGLFWSLSPLQETLGYAYIDNLLMMFSWAAMVAMTMALREQSSPGTGWVVICGLLAGTAAGTKLFGAVIVIMIGITLLFNKGWRRQSVWLYSASAGLFGLGWYIRSYIISGDPIHPAGGNFFGHYLWNSADLLSQQQEQATHGTSKNPLLLFSSLQKAGILCLLPGLLSLLQPRLWHVSTRALALIVLTYILAWQTTSQVARYTTPILPAGVFLTTAWLFYAGPEQLQKKLRKFSPALSWIGLIILTALALSWPYNKRGIVSAESKTWSQSLESRSGFKVMQAANDLRHKLGNKIIQIGYENAVYFFEGQVIGDWFGPGRYSQMLNCTTDCHVADAEKLKRLLDQHGANMLAVNAARFKFIPSEYITLFDVQTISPGNYLLILKSMQH